MTLSQPALQLPAPLRGAEIGSFAHYTIITRLPAIARRVMSENNLPQAAVHKIQELIADLPTSGIRPLQDEDAPDAQEWLSYIQPFQGWNWLEITWFFAETYFYRRILEATGFYTAGEAGGLDPYAYQKVEGLTAFQKAIIDSCSLLEDGLEQESCHDCQNIIALIYGNLWGNQADLSMWPAGHGERPENQQSHLLCDDSQVAAKYLCDLRQARVDFILDNAGLELVNDLLLADFLLSRGMAGEIHLHAKPHPTFVSDVTPADVLRSIDFMRTLAHPDVSQVVCRLYAHCESEHLKIDTHYYWTSPLAGWEMPEDLVEQFKQIDLLISKGDANYRRLIGDRRWPMTTLPAQVFGYLPAPVLALRVSKSEAIIGLQPGQSEELFQQDPRWQINGSWGMVQFST
jgi:uncharacterized protein with ATP-grasp and redox domains